MKVRNIAPHVEREANSHSLCVIEEVISFSDFHVWHYIRGQPPETLLHTLREKPIATHYVLLKLFLEVIWFSGFHMWHYIRGQPPETLSAHVERKAKIMLSSLLS